MSTFKFFRKETFEQQIHRAGWNWVIQNMYEKYHNDDSEVILDDFIEKTFDWDYLKLKNSNNIPHLKQPWIGFVHNPFMCPKPFDIKASALNICSRRPFLESIKNCRGLFTLSEDLAESLEYLLGSFGINFIPIESIKHPTILDVPQFNLDKFKNNPAISNIGYWLRDFTPLFLLDTDFPKYAVLGKLKYAHDNYNLQLQNFNYNSKLTGEKRRGTTIIQRPLDNEEYDEMLTSRICFMNIIDSSANNGVIECIARSTPLLINPHPAIVEYLGEDYPFYYLSQEGANKKINDLALIEKTHMFMREMCKKSLSLETFLRTFEYSDIYNNI